MRQTLKRLTSLTLAFIVLCSVTVSAFAASVPLESDLAASEPATPLYEQFGFDSPEAFIDANFWWDVPSYDWVCERYLQNYDEIIQNPQYALDIYGIVGMEELAMLIGEGYWESDEAFYREAALYLTVNDWDLYVPPLSVQFNGETVVFPDAQPELTGGRTMVPVRVMAEEMGYEVSYHNGGVQIENGENKITFLIGSTEYELVVVQNPSRETDGTAGASGCCESQLHRLDMDVAPYIKENRTYVPVRFFAEAFGMTVLWDADRNMAVIYDGEALKAEINKDFSVVNAWLAVQPELDEDAAVREIVSMALSYTQLDSLNGDKVYPVQAMVEVVSQGESFNMELELDMYAVMRALVPEIAEDPEYTLSMLERLKDELENVELEFLYDADADRAYLRCPLALSIFAYMAEQTDSDMVSIDTDALMVKVREAKDTWLRIDEFMDIAAGGSGFSGFYGSGISEITEAFSSPTMGDFILTLSEGGNYPAEVYAMAMEGHDAISAVIGDSRFTRNGNSYTVSLNTFLGMEDEPMYGIETDSSGYITLNTATGAIDMELEQWMLDYNGERRAQMSLAFKGVGTDGTVTYEQHVRNQYIVNLNIDFALRESSAAPAKQPPERAKIISLDELYGYTQMEVPIGIAGGSAY